MERLSEARKSASASGGTTGEGRAESPKRESRSAGPVAEERNESSSSIGAASVGGREGKATEKGRSG